MAFYYSLKLNTMTKQEAKDIATVLIGKTAICFDGEAFTECKPELSEKEMNKIIIEIQKISEQMISKVEKKLNVSFNNASSSHKIVDLILYEQ